MEIQPKDPSKGHFYASMAKSSLRIGAAVFLGFGNLAMAASLFIVAEILGIVEELI